MIYEVTTAGPCSPRRVHTTYDKERGVPRIELKTTQDLESELDQVRNDIGKLSSKIDHLYQRVDEAHGEALAGSWLLTKMLHMPGLKAETLLDDPIEALLPFPSGKPLSPVDRAALSAIRRLRDSLSHQIRSRHDKPSQ